MIKPYFETELGKLYHGDCLEVMKEIEDESVDLILTDPPYFLPATHYSVRSGGFRSLSDLSMLEYFFYSVFKEFNRVLKHDGYCYLFCNGQSYPVFYALNYQLFKRLRPLIWDKQTSINGYAWRHQHELILFCERENVIPIKTGDGDIIKCRAVPIKERKHLAEKPVELFEKLINKIKPSIVLDPFIGSGTTAIACRRLNRKFIGIEKSKEYCDLTVQRIKQETAQYKMNLSI